MTDFNYLLRNTRELWGLTQTEMADKLQISRSYYPFIERGERKFPPEKLYYLSKMTSETYSQLIYMLTGFDTAKFEPVPQTVEVDRESGWIRVEGGYFLPISRLEP